MKIGDIVRYVEGSAFGVVNTITEDAYQTRVCITRQADNKTMWLDDDDLVVVESCKATIGSPVKDLNHFDLTIISVVAYKTFRCKYKYDGMIVNVSWNNLRTIDGGLIYSNENKEIKKVNVTKPETQSQKAACAEAIQDAVSAKLAEDKKQYTAGMAEYIKVEGERRKLEAQAKDLEEKLGITAEIKAQLF